MRCEIVAAPLVLSREYMLTNANDVSRACSRRDYERSRGGRLVMHARHAFPRVVFSRGLRSPVISEPGDICSLMCPRVERISPSGETAGVFIRVRVTLDVQQRREGPFRPKSWEFRATRRDTVVSLINRLSPLLLDGGTIL